MSLYVDSGRLVDAVQVAKQIVMLNVSTTGREADYAWLVWPYGVLGLHEQAKRWCRREEGVSPDSVQARLYCRAMESLLYGTTQYATTARQFEQELQAAGLALDQLSRQFKQVYGILLALAGDAESAVRILEPMADNFAGDWDMEGKLDAAHALAWEWRNAGESGKAAALLAAHDLEFRQSQDDGQLHLSDMRFAYARNTLLRGDPNGALAQLEEAVEAGWRGYYGALRDPRWGELRDDSRFQSLMARVKADIEAQRARMEQIDAEDDFEARLDAAIEVRAAADARAGGTGKHN